MNLASTEASTFHPPTTLGHRRWLIGLLLGIAFVATLFAIWWFGFQPFPPQRLAVIEKLATVQTPALFAAVIMHNRYDLADQLQLQPIANRWQFAQLAGTRNQHLSLATANLAAPYFEGRAVGDQTIFSPVIAQDPLQRIYGMADCACERNFTASASEENDLQLAALRYSLAHTFGDAITHPELAGWQAEAEERLLTGDLSRLPIEFLVDLDRAATGTLAERTRAALLAQIPATGTTDLLDAQGTPKLRLLGYAVERTAVDRNTARLTLYFEPLAPLQHDYQIWLHAEHDQEQLKLDHWPNLRTSVWEVGKIYRHTTPLALAPGDYQLTLGFWARETDEHLLPNAQESGIVLGTVQLPLRR